MQPGDHHHTVFAQITALVWSAVGFSASSLPGPRLDCVRCHARHRAMLRAYLSSIFENPLSKGLLPIHLCTGHGICPIARVGDQTICATPCSVRGLSTSGLALQLAYSSHVAIYGRPERAFRRLLRADRRRALSPLRPYSCSSLGPLANHSVAGGDIVAVVERHR